MTLEEIERKVNAIDVLSEDAEAAHGAEDKLYHDFIRYLSLHAETEPLRRSASAILKTEKILFSRWRA